MFYQRFEESDEGDRQMGFGGWWPVVTGLLQEMH